MRKRLPFLSLLFATLFASLSVAQDQQKDIKSSYDRFKDETSVAITIAKTNMTPTYDSSTWTIETVFQGEKRPKDPPLVLELFITGSVWKLLRADLTLRAFIGDERITIGTMKRIYSDVHGGATMEVATVPLPIEMLRKIAAANKFEVQIAGEEKSFSDVERARFKTFLDYLNQKDLADK